MAPKGTYGSTWDSYANLFSHKSMEILDLGEREEDAQLTRFSTVSVAKSVLRNYIDI